MDKAAIIFRAIEIIPRFMPRPKPPVIDHTPLYEALPRQELPQVETFEVKSTDVIKTKTEVIPAPAAEEDVSTSCLSCSRSHLSTVSGALSESLRFARESGMEHPEVQRRILLSEDEINIMERIDLAPDALASSPEEERTLAQEYLPRIRELRQKLGQITSVEQLEQTAADASLLSQEFRLRHLQLQGVDLNPVMELAKKVQQGEITIDDAKKQLKEILPEEE